MKSGTSKSKESRNQQAKNNESNKDEPPSILKEPVKKAGKACNYDKEYLKFGFSWTEDGKKTIPLWVICFKNLTNESMETSNLKPNLEINNNKYKDKPIDLFENKLKNLNQSQKVMQSLTGGDSQKIL